MQANQPYSDETGHATAKSPVQAAMHTEERLRASELSYRRLFEAAKDGILILDADTGCINDVNPFLAKMLGYSHSELVGQTVWELGPFKDIVANKAKFAQLQQQGYVRYENLPLEARDGRHHAVEFVSNVYLAGDQTVIQCNIRDITERKHAEDEKRAAQEALLDSEERFRKLNECSPLGVMLLDTKGHCTYCNPAGRNLFGTTLMESMGMGWARLIAPADRKSVIQDWRAALRNGKEFSCMFSVRVPEQGVRWLSARSAPITRDESLTLEHVAILEDLSERKRMEALFIEAQKMEAVGHLAGGVAHDFNNMLAVILGYSDIVMARLKPDDPTRKHVEQIHLATERAVGLTRQLLAFSRKQELQPVVLDLNAVIGEMDKMLRRLIDENVELSVVPGKTLGRIKADAGYVGQVLMNLVVNARDAMPNGGKLTIETSNVTSDATYAQAHAGVTHGDYVMLAVSDTGTGMTEEVKARMFEALFTTKPKGKGTGLGLSTCQTIVKQSGGHIAVNSELGKGTMFKVYFPRVAQSLDVSAQPVKAGALPRGTETLLVVEDEPAVRHLAAGVLEAQGYNVLRASNGQDGLRVAREHKGSPIGLVVTDVVMPLMNGTVMAEWLKSTYPELKILFTSGYTDDAIAQHGVLEAGVAFLPKPYTPSILATKVRDMLDG
jgi:two-component system cell cycle sensor histidine kinase/response regulator CckA